MNPFLKHTRNSKINLNDVYFWTATIKDWKHLLKPDKYEQIVIDELAKLADRNLIVIYGFVIMPNHLHLIWELSDMNGREMPHASFNKASAHVIVKDLKTHHTKVLSYFKVNDKERSYRIWQRDSLAILMDSQEKLDQKLEYIHNNPLQEHWNLCSRPEEYKWSSALFYETGIDDFGFLTHYSETFG